MSRPRNGISAAAYDRRVEERALADFYEVVRPDTESKRPTAEQVVNFTNGYLTGRWLARLVRNIFHH